MMVVVVAVAVTLVVGLLLLGGLGSGSSGGSGGVTYSSARTAADRLAAGHGSWELIEVVGLAPANSTTLPFNSTSVPNCTVSVLVGSVPSEISIPAYRGNLLDGSASMWLFAYVQPSTGSELAVVTVNGAVALAATVTGTCLGQYVETIPEIPDTVVDSSVAVSAAAAVGGAAFVRAHPTGVSLQMFMLNGLPFDNASKAPEWEVSFSTCPSTLFNTGSSSSPGSTFSVAVNATTGAVLAGSESTSTCGPGIPPPPPPTGIGQALGLGLITLFHGSGTGGTIASQGCASTDYCYSVAVTAAQNVTPADFESYVSTSSGAQASVAGFAILNVTGSVVVYSTGSTEVQWSSGVGSPATLLTAGMTLVVDVGTQDPAGQSMILQIAGEGAYSGSGISVYLP